MTNQKPTLEDKELFLLCQEQNSKAQELIYRKHSGSLMVTCQRYMRTAHDAEEALIQGFYKIFRGIDKVEWRGNAAFKGWLKRVVVNECLMALRKNQREKAESGLENIHSTSNLSAESDLMEQEVLTLITKLPNGYRTVFNMYIIEGYNHKEIAEKLGIQESTSKSQLSKARKLLQKWIQQQN